MHRLPHLSETRSKRLVPGAYAVKIHFCADDFRLLAPIQTEHLLALNRQMRRYAPLVAGSNKDRLHSLQLLQAMVSVAMVPVVALELAGCRAVVRQRSRRNSNTQV